MKKQKNSTYRIDPVPLDLFLLIKVEGKWEGHQPWLAYRIDPHSRRTLDFTFLFRIKGEWRGIDNE